MQLGPRSVGHLVVNGVAQERVAESEPLATLGRAFGSDELTPNQTHERAAKRELDLLTE